MADILNMGAAWLAGKLQTHASQSVTYLRGSQEVGSSLKATYGQTTFEQDTTAGIIRWESKDFIFKASDLTLNGDVVEPANGDKMTDHNGNTFEALGSNGEPCFRYMDGSRLMVRIHTKQVA